MLFKPSGSILETIQRYISNYVLPRVHRAEESLNPGVRIIINSLFRHVLLFTLLIYIAFILPPFKVILYSYLILKKMNERITDS